MDDRGRVLLAIQAIHEATIAPDGFTEALAAAVRAARADRALFTTEDPKSASMKHVIGVGYESGMVDLFKRFRTQELPSPHLAIPAGQVRRCSDIMSDRALKRTAAYADVIKPSGDATHALLVPSMIRTRGEWTTLTLARRSGTPDFDNVDVETMCVIVPHLNTAWRTRRLLGELNLRASGVCAAMDRLQSGVIVVDDSMRPIYMNARAAAWVTSGDGLVVSNGLIASVNPDETRSIHRAAAAAIKLYRTDSDNSAFLCREPPKQILISRPERRMPLIASVVPLSADSVDWINPATGIAAIFVYEFCDPLNLNIQSARYSYGLSSREMDILTHLVRGSDLKKTAALLEIGIGTARWHLKHIFEKTNTHRQAELISLVIRGMSGQDFERRHAMVPR